MFQRVSKLRVGVGEVRVDGHGKDLGLRTLILNPESSLCAYIHVHDFLHVRLRVCVCVCVCICVYIYRCRPYTLT